jgi:glucosamine-6-phosphate isomerase
MKIFIDDTYEAMSKRVANNVVNIMRTASKPLFCAASGDSPRGLYKELVQQNNASAIDISNWYFLGLDEWIGLDENDEGSCRYILNKDLFHPLHIKDEMLCCFNGKTTDTTKECDRIETFIQQHNGIDVAIVGIGMNGHIGLNEPGTLPLLRSHVSDIAESTKTVGQKYFSKEQALTKGITLGLATLMEAKHLFLIVSGEKKAAILKEALQHEPTENIPATLIRDHPNFYVYADKAAAKLLTDLS